MGAQGRESEVVGEGQGGASFSYCVVKVLFGYRKTMYRGLSKNLNRLQVLFTSAHLLMWAWAGAPCR